MALTFLCCIPTLLGPLLYHIQWLHLDLHNQLCRHLRNPHHNHSYRHSAIIQLVQFTLPAYWLTGNSCEQNIKLCAVIATTIYPIMSPTVWMAVHRRTYVPVGLLRSGHRCPHSASPAFHQSSTTCSTLLPAQHLRPSGLLSRPPQSLAYSSLPDLIGDPTISAYCFRRLLKTYLFTRY